MRDETEGQARGRRPAAAGRAPKPRQKQQQPTSSSPAAPRRAPRSRAAAVTGDERARRWDLLDHMRAAALDAARYLAARAEDRASLDWQSKSPSDFVTDADTGAEARIHEILIDPPPGWGTGLDIRFVGEETSPDETHGPGITYVVDPLDGTANFLHGYPWYAVSIAALVDGELIAGVVHNVATGDVFSAFSGGGSRLNDRRIAVSEITDPARALLGTGLPFKHHEHVEPYLRSLPRLLRSTAGVRRAGSAALDLCDVACGRFEAFWELSLSPWDMAAGMLIIREAGGLVTDLDGRDAEVALGPVVAGNPAMHGWLLDVLRDEGTAL